MSAVDVFNFSLLCVTHCVSVRGGLYTVMSLLLHVQIIVEGKTGAGVSGDIAIDDFDISPGICPQPGKYDYNISLLF